MDPAMKCRLRTQECLLPGTDAEDATRPAPLNPRPSRAPSRLRISDFRFQISRFRRAAFSLLEVMIACGIFFMAIFAILGLISTILRNARGLRRVDVDAGMVAAQVCKTNKLFEGTESGDFGNLYPDYSWETYTSEVATNHLFQVDITVRRRGLQNPADTMSIWVYAPESPSQGFGRPTIR
jgi:hypothetical protein